MKPHVRYGHTPHSTAGGGRGGGGGGGLYPPPQYRRPAGEDGVDGGAMIEEYKLEEQLAPFYGEAASAPSPRCYLPPGPSGTASANGVKPTLRTVSIMETLSELTNSARVEGSTASAGRRPDVKGPGTVPASKSTVPQHIVKRKKVAPVPNNGGSGVASLLDIPQWYPKRPSRPEQSSVPATSPRVWDVSRLSSKLGVSPGSKSGPIGRSVEHILSSSSIQPVPSSTSAHGYGSLERKRRRRPGARGAGLSARRGETDWEREEDEEDEMMERNVPVESPAHHYHSVGALVLPGTLFPRGRNKQQVDPGERDRERERQSYKPPTEWFKKKRPPPQPSSNNNNNIILNNKTSGDVGKKEQQPRGQTPDWIHKIFHVARRGNLLKLVFNLLRRTSLSPPFLFKGIFSFLFPSI